MRVSLYVKYFIEKNKSMYLSTYFNKSIYRLKDWQVLKN